MKISVPKPPADFQNPQTIELQAGEEIVRVHSDAFAANSFNPCGGSETRFAPIHNAEGECIASLYAASNLIAGIYETIFHDAPVMPGPTSYSIPKQNIVDREYSVLTLERRLTLLSLRAPDLRNFGLKRLELIEAPAEFYEDTARWAKAFHEALPDIDGLVWTSRQCDPESCYLFFGDRVRSEDFEVAETHHVMDGDQHFLDQIRSAGMRAGIKISLQS